MNVGVVFAEFAQGDGEVGQVVAVGAAGPGRARDVAGDFLFARFAQEGFVVLARHVHHAFRSLGCLRCAIGSRRSVVERHLHRHPQVAVLFPVVQVFKDFRRDQVSHAMADGAGLGDDGDHPARRGRRAAMVVRALPEAPRPEGPMASPSDWCQFSAQHSAVKAVARSASFMSASALPRNACMARISERACSAPSPCPE
eukprot:gene32787-40470_t